MLANHTPYCFKYVYYNIYVMLANQTPYCFKCIHYKIIAIMH